MKMWRCLALLCLCGLAASGCGDDDSGEPGGGAGGTGANSGGSGAGSGGALAPRADGGMPDGGDVIDSGRPLGDSGAPDSSTDPDEDAGAPREYGLCGSAVIAGVDGDCDGQLDRHCSILLRTSNDDMTDGIRAMDEDCDGFADTQCEVFDWDEAEQVLSYLREPACDGSVVSCSRQSYDLDGAYLDSFEDTACNGRDSADVYCVDTDYDAEQRIAERLIDEDCNGADNWCEITAYDEDGNVLRVEEREGSCDGAPRRCVERQRAGLVVTETIDQGCDGSDDVCMTTTLNADGLELAIDGDLGCDGPSSDDLCTEVVRDDPDEAIYRYDDGCNGSVDSCGGTDHVYEGGRLTRSEQLNGSCSDPQTCIEHEYDATDRRSGYFADFHCDGIRDADFFDTCVTLIYEGDAIVGEVRDDDCDDTRCGVTRNETDVCL